MNRTLRIFDKIAVIIRSWICWYTCQEFESWRIKIIKDACISAMFLMHFTNRLLRELIIIHMCVKSRYIIDLVIGQALWHYNVCIVCQISWMAGLIWFIKLLNLDQIIWMIYRGKIELHAQSSAGYWLLSVKTECWLIKLTLTWNLWYYENFGAFN